MASPGSKGVPSKVAVNVACAMMMWLEPVMLRTQGMVLKGVVVNNLLADQSLHTLLVQRRRT
jgi:hypothetical protein